MKIEWDIFKSKHKCYLCDIINGCPTIDDFPIACSECPGNTLELFTYEEAIKTMKNWSKGKIDENN